MGDHSWIMHIDLDAFFAAVEQRDKPSLRGKPVVVGGVGPRGVVATASYEARKYGVRSAMSTLEARRKCPHAAVLAGRFEAYSNESRIVMDLLGDISPTVEPVSLDEAYVDLSHLNLDYSSTAEFAERLLEQISLATGGITASVGIASTKLLAKIGSELNKPNGYFIVARGSETEVLDPLPVRALPGIGPAAEERLHHVGVTHVSHLRGFQASELQGILGDAAGIKLWNMVRANDARRVEPHRVRKSIGIEDTFAQDVSGLPSLNIELQRLVDTLVSRMTHQGISGRTISVKIRDSLFTTTTKSLTLEGATHSHAVVSDTALRLLEIASPEAPVRLLGVSVSGLSPWIQGDLFDSVGVRTAATTDALATARPPEKQQRDLIPRTWLPGMDVRHSDHGAGWVWGSGLGKVTIRFETRDTDPGPVRTFNSEDPLLSPSH